MLVAAKLANSPLMRGQTAQFDLKIELAYAKCEQYITCPAICQHLFAYFFVKACPKLDLPAFSWYSIFGCGAKKDCRQAKRHDILKKER